MEDSITTTEFAALEPGDIVLFERRRFSFIRHDKDHVGFAWFLSEAGIKHNIPFNHLKVNRQR